MSHVPDILLWIFYIDGAKLMSLKKTLTKHNQDKEHEAWACVIGRGEHI